MKKSSQFLLIALAIFILGIFWRITGAYIQAKVSKAAAENETTSNADTITATAKPETAPAIEVKPYAAIAPKSEWNDILIGEWGVSEAERNDVDAWFISSDIEFEKDKTFTLHTTIEYYDYESFVGTEKKRKANIKAGGKVSGLWRLNNDILQLASSYCKIDTSYMSGETEMLQSIDYSQHEVRSCDYFQQRKYGNLSNDTYKMQIEKFNNDSIYITGKNFTTGATVTYLFTKK